MWTDKWKRKHNKETRMKTVLNEDMEMKKEKG